MDFKDIEKGSETAKDKISYFKEALKNQDNKDAERDIKKNLIKLLKEKPLKTYTLAYDAFGEGLEPIYFWTLDFMRDSDPSGLGLNVTKVGEGLEASASSGYFSDIGGKASVMQDRAMKILQTVNAIVKSIINLIYDLKEFETRLEAYDDLNGKDKLKREGGRLSLKGVWMDQVDIKKGRGSINMMAQQLQFVTLRDAFMAAENLEFAKKIDLNDRVMNILLKKLEEYFLWEKASEKELRKRFEIERSYLKTQIDSLKLYTTWLTPYLKAAQKLGMKEFNTGNIISGFNNMEMELSLIGKKELKPGDVHENLAKVKLARKYFACLEVDFHFRSVPQQLQGKGGSHYIHTGKTDILFKAYAFDDEELKLVEEQELYENLDMVEQLTKVSLKELQDDIDHFLKKPDKCPKCGKELERGKKECKECGYGKKKESFNPFGDLGKGFGEMVKPMKEIFSLFKPSTNVSFLNRRLKEESAKKAKGLAFTAYDVYKKAHGMTTW